MGTTPATAGHGAIGAVPRPGAGDAMAAAGRHRRHLVLALWLLVLGCGAAAQSPPSAGGSPPPGTSSTRAAAPSAASAPLAGAADFNAAERTFLQAFSLSRLPSPPPAPSNAWADDPAAAALGQRLFFDRRLSAGERFACASCHQPARHFTDGLPQAVASGRARRSTPSLLGAAHLPWLDWDGRADSLWAQALGPIEDPQELALTRAEYVVRLRLQVRRLPQDRPALEPAAVGCRRAAHPALLAVLSAGWLHAWANGGLLLSLTRDRGSARGIH